MRRREHIIVNMPFFIITTIKKNALSKLKLIVSRTKNMLETNNGKINETGSY